MIENEAGAVAADARRVIEAAVVAHSERNNGQATHRLLFHQLKRNPIQLSDWCCGCARLKKVGHGGGEMLQTGLVGIHADAAFFIVDESCGAISSLDLR